MCTGYKYDAFLLSLRDRLFVTVKLYFRGTNHAACCKIHVAPVPLLYIPQSVLGSGHGKAMGYRFMHAAIFSCTIICFFLYIKILPNQIGGLTFDESVSGIVTCYGLGGRGIESRWGRDFSALVQTGPAAHPVSCTMGYRVFPGRGMRPGRGVDHPPPSSVQLKEAVE